MSQARRGGIDLRLHRVRTRARLVQFTTAKPLFSIPLLAFGPLASHVTLPNLDDLKAFYEVSPICTAM